MARREVLGYVRSDPAGDRGVDPQSRELRQACRERDWRLVGVVADEAPVESLDRPGLRGALEAIAAGEAGTLAATGLDRLAGSLADLTDLLDWLEQVGGELVALDLGLDTGTPSGRRTAAVLQAVAGWEAQRDAERARRRREGARERGHSPGRPAVADDPHLSRRIAEMREQGMTLQSIADVLNDEGVPTPRGGAHWRPSSVQAAAGYRRPPPPGPLPPPPPPHAHPPPPPHRRGRP
jgi:DNA invertase Pin-like site-specific DNA recombinase